LDAGAGQVLDPLTVATFCCRQDPVGPVPVAFSCERTSHGAPGPLGRTIDGHEPVRTCVLHLYVAIWSQAYADVTLRRMVWRVTRLRKPHGHTAHALSEPAEREAEAPLHVRP
jgi:hypothetical protein